MIGSRHRRRKPTGRGSPPIPRVRLGVPAAERGADTLASALILRMRGAAQKERWGMSLLQIAWTAGPVTYMALQGGYYVGYGKAAPNNLFLYFAIYTVIAGAFALIVRFLYAMTRGLDKDKDRQALERVFDSLPGRILEIREMQIRALGEEGRRILGAKYLLEDFDTEPDAVAAAFMELTQDREIALLAHDMEVLRNRGLGVPAEAKAESLRHLIRPHLPGLKVKSEEIVRLVERRLEGDGLLSRSRRLRTGGFLERVLSAHESDNLDLMSIVDAEEVCILVFELICGRRFPLFLVDYVGDRAFMDAAGRLAEARRDYRAAVNRRNNRLRTLAEMLYGEPGAKRRGPAVRRGDRTVIRRVLSSLPTIRSAQNLQDKVIEALRDFLSDAAKGAKQRKRLLVLYERLRSDGRQVERSYAAFRKAWNAYNSTLERLDEHSVRLLHPGDSGRGFRIVAREVSLETKQVLPLAREIDERLVEFTLEHEHADIKANDQKELAVSLLQAIERYLDLDDPVVRRSIESTHSVSVESLAKAVTASAGERAWLDQISDARDSSRRGILETLKSLVQHFRLSLEPRDIAYLADSWHADTEVLEALLPEASAAGSVPFPVPDPVPPPPPPEDLFSPGGGGGSVKA